MAALSYMVSRSNSTASPLSLSLILCVTFQQMSVAIWLCLQMFQHPSLKIRSLLTEHQHDYHIQNANRHSVSADIQVTYSQEFGLSVRICMPTRKAHLFKAGNDLLDLIIPGLGSIIWQETGSRKGREGCTFSDHFGQGAVDPLEPEEDTISWKHTCFCFERFL